MPRWKKIAAAVGLALGALVGIGWYWARHLRVSREVRDRVAVELATREIDILADRRAELEAAEVRDSGTIAEIDRDLAKARRRIVEAHDRGQGLRDDEILPALERLGY